MESPDESRKVPPAAARASPSKDSPFYNYISNLSPLNQNKDTRVGQRLFNVRSPPPVFTSPRETKLLERIQMSELSTADLLTLCGTENEISSVVPSVSHSSAAQVILIPYAHAFDKVTGDAENQSPPGSIDKYLADTSEECENLSCPCPPNLHSDKFVELPHNFKASAKCADERSLTNDGNQNNQKDVKIKAGTQIISAESTPESLLKGTLLVDANVDVRIIQKIDKRATKIVQHMDSSNVPGADSSHSSASAESRYLRDPTLTGIGRNEHDKQMRDASLSTHECYAQETQALKEHEIGMTSQVNLEQEMVPCSDLLQNIDLDQFCMENLEMEAQRGAPRRCLQFQAGGKNVAKIKTSRSLSTTPQIMFHDTGSSMETLETLNINTCGKIDGAVGTKLMPNPCQHASSAVKLHASSSLRDGNRGSNLSTDVKTNSFVAAHIPSGIGLHLNSIGKARVGINIQKGQYFSDNGHTLTEDVKSLLPGSSKSLRISPLHLNECGLSPAPNDQKDPAESENCKVEDIDRMSPKNIRKRSADSNGDEECRRCNCKKSKCLKLYCECFAAGLYCSKPCSCQGCFNKPEYEDKVMETRQLIESRNPIAFAPKVVHCVAVSPKNVDEEGNKTTPASARHKRGCNCKKSMCLKKYCECFQAGVGCSDACRCEGCKNLFGRKEGIISLNHLKAERARWRKEPEGKAELADTILEMEPSEENDDVLQVGHCLGGPPSPRSLFRCSNRELVLPRSWQHPKRHLTSSPDSESSAASTRGKSPNSSMKSSLSVRVLKASAQDLDIQLPGKKNIMTSSWNGLIDSRNVLPTRDYQSIGCASSSNPCLKSSQTMQSHVRLSKAHGSPITPVSRFGNTKYEDPLGNSSSKYLEDETPEILKETRSPIKAVKANSPNQKRVSPPQDCSEGIRPTTISPSVRSGRRFVLQSVPSFPPLTPYKDSKKSEK